MGTGNISRGVKADGE